MPFTPETARAAAKKQAREYTEDEVTAGLMALIAWAGNATAASRYLKNEKGLDIKHATLNSWKTTHGPRYAEMREKYSGELEAHLIGEMRDVAVLATAVERVGLEKARQRLESGKDDDPARTASHASRVRQSSVDKLLSLTGRPTRISQERSPEELVRSLIAMGVVVPQLTEGDKKKD